MDTQHHNRDLEDCGVMLRVRKRVDLLDIPMILIMIYVLLPIRIFVNLVSNLSGLY